MIINFINLPLQIDLLRPITIIMEFIVQILTVYQWSIFKFQAFVVFILVDSICFLFDFGFLFEGVQVIRRGFLGRISFRCNAISHIISLYFYFIIQPKIKLYNIQLKHITYKQKITHILILNLKKQIPLIIIQITSNIINQIEIYKRGIFLYNFIQFKGSSVDYTMTDYTELLKLDFFQASCPSGNLPLLSTSILQLSTGRNMTGGTKIYIGFLPVSMNEAALREVFQRHCQVSQVIIKKGNAQGHFDKFCYGFVTMNMSQKEANDIIAKISNEHPNWKLKIKEDGPEHPRQQKFPRPTNNYQQQQQFQPPNMYHQIPQQIPPPPQMMQMQPPMISHHHQHQQHQQHQSIPPQIHQNFQPISHHQPQYSQPRTQNQNFNNSQQPQNDKGEIYGEKRNRIMVRQLWLGGIPEMIDHSYMTEVMSEFGIVEATEIFPKFAFVKYKRAVDAAIAYERASRIYEIFGQNSGFRIAFSDPSRRKEIVGNHYEFQRNSAMLPVLFLGFPPITSANVEINHMLGICEKFGPITNYYLKKSTNTQMRSYILFTYDNIKNAIRAKQQLCRRKDLLGEKRVQITLLLDEQSVLKGRDFSNTQRNFINEQGGMEKNKKPPQKTGFNPNSQSMYSGGYQPPLVPGNYIPPPTSNIPTGGYIPGQIPPPYGQTPGNFNGMNHYYPPNYQVSKQSQKFNQASSHEVLALLQSVYDDPSEDKKKGPQKKAQDKSESTNDIISKMLGKSEKDKKNEQASDEGQIREHQHQIRDNKQPNWSGFITWKGSRRTGVDGFATKQTDFSDYIINVTSLVYNSEAIFKEKANIMVLEPTNSISQPVFNEYLKVFKTRTGVSVAKNWLIYLIGKNNLSDTIHPIKDNQLLVVMEKASLTQQLRDKVLPCNDSYFD